MQFIPYNVSYILHKLDDMGYEAYIVGGCVRDMVMKRKPHDFDICTAASPQKVIEIFEADGKEVILTGIQHGTVSVVIDKEVFEITTFRIDGSYEDGRHPNSVVFTTDVEKDLARRDFTINAMAYSPLVGLIDPFNGLEDIKKKILRTVGNPKDRFAEDALRILRAVRFQAVLGFSIDFNTKAEMRAQRENLLKISKERICAEMNKMFEGIYLSKAINNFKDIMVPIIPEFKDMVGFNQHNPYHKYDVWLHTYHTIKSCPLDRITRLAALFHDIGKPHCFQQEEINGELRFHFKGHAEKSVEITEEILKDLRFSNKDIEEILLLIKYHDVTFSPTKKFIRKMLTKMSREDLKKLIALRVADVLGQGLADMRDDRIVRAFDTFELLMHFDDEEECFSLKQLAIDGNDLKEIGMKPGPQMGKVLNTLLEMVIQEEIENEKEVLLDFVTNKWKE